LADSDDHDLAYSLGASLGERLRQEMPGLQLDALVEGLKQSYQGQTLGSTRHACRRCSSNEAQEGDASVQKLQAAETRFMANERGRAGVHELAEGVLYSELQQAGAQPKAGGKVQVRCGQVA
jgi:FKBP-type peptidyl-prolyl cis-trans isomerase FklB